MSKITGVDTPASVECIEYDHLNLANIYLSFHGRHFLTLKDFTANEIQQLLDFTAALKVRREKNKKLRRKGDYLEGKHFVLLFEKDSTRTRCAFEVGIGDEGGSVTCLSSGSHIGKKESVADTARVLGRMYDGIEYRGFGQDVVRILADNAGVPVWNGLTDEFHPTQILADLATVSAYLKRKNVKVSNEGRVLWNEVKFVYVGDGRNNMGNSLMIGCTKLGLQFVFLCPTELFPDPTLLSYAEKEALESGGSVQCIQIHQKELALMHADVVYTDVWVSMGEEDQLEDRMKLLGPYQVNQEMMNCTNNCDTVFLHCLPAFHDSNTKFGEEVMAHHGYKSGLEVTDEVFRSPSSLVFDQAEYRLHSIKAVVCATCGEFENYPL